MLSKALKALSSKSIHHLVEMLGVITDPLRSYHHNMTTVKPITLNKPFQVFSHLEKYVFYYYQIFALVSKNAFTGASFYEADENEASVYLFS